MTWEELCKKAYEMGYEDFYVYGELRAIWNSELLSFRSDGTICYDVLTFAKNRTYEQMLAIMEALR